MQPSIAARRLRRFGGQAGRDEAARQGHGPLNRSRGARRQPNRAQAARRCDGLVELPKPRGLAPGMRVRVISGPLSERIGMLALLKPRERVLVLLQLLGGQQRVELARNAIEAV